MKLIFMALAEEIYTRKSCRKYSIEKLSEKQLDDIRNFISNIRVLDDSIDFRYDILAKDEVNIRTRWSAPYYLALYSEKRDLYGENIGFAFEQVCLYMQSIGIGNCWVGLAKPKVRDDEFVITIAFGKSDDISRDISQFKRKQLEDISDFADDALLPALYAPSAVNSQPWYFRHASEGFDVYQVTGNPLKRKVLGKWNPIDIGIALAHLYVENPESFEFWLRDDFEDVKGYTYIGSVSI